MSRFRHHEGAFYDYLPDSATINELVAPALLVAVPDSAADNGLAIRVYGYDTSGKRIFGADALDGFPVVVNTTATPATQRFARIERISKPASKGFIKLSTWNTTTSLPDLLLGYYLPDELEPTYRRLRVSRSCASIRISFRKRERLITSLSDVINLRSKPAIVNAVAALSCRLADPARAQELMAQAVGWLKDEQAQRDQNMPPRPPEHFGQSDMEQDWGGYY